MPRVMQRQSDIEAQKGFSVDCVKIKHLETAS